MHADGARAHTDTRVLAVALAGSPPSGSAAPGLFSDQFSNEARDGVFDEFPCDM